MLDANADVGEDLRRPEPPLALLLLRASRWFDRRLLPALAAGGGPALTAAQSLVFGHLDPFGTRPAELARRLGTSRQATADLLTGLVKLGIVQVTHDATRRRGRLVVLTDTGRELAQAAQQQLQRLEDILNPSAVARLRDVLVELGLDFPEYTDSTTHASARPCPTGTTVSLRGDTPEENCQVP